MRNIRNRKYRISIDEARIIRCNRWIYSRVKGLKIKIRKYRKPKDVIELIDHTMTSLEHWVYRMAHNISPNDERFDTEEKVIEYAIKKYGLNKYINKMEDNTWKENLIQKHKELKEATATLEGRGRVQIKIPLNSSEETTESLAVRLLGEQNS